MERSAAAVRMQEAIPTPLRFAGWVLLIVPALAIMPQELQSTQLVRTFLDENLATLGLGTGIAPLEFFAFAWLVVGLVFFLQAYFSGQRLGPKSTMIFGTAVVAQAVMLVASTVA